jgi:hypothetical protein
MEERYLIRVVGERKHRPRRVVLLEHLPRRRGGHNNGVHFFGNTCKGGKIPMINDLENIIKKLDGVLNVYQSEGETGRRYINVEFSFDANDSSLSKKISDILNS